LSGYTAAEIKQAMEVRIPCEVLDEESLVKCECGFEGRAKITFKEHDLVLFECPDCGKVPEILKGGDIILKDICV